MVYLIRWVVWIIGKKVAVGPEWRLGRDIFYRAKEQPRAATIVQSCQFQEAIEDLFTFSL